MDELRNELNYCPRCAGRLASRPVEAKPRLVCDQCGFVFYLDPKLAVAVVLPYQGGILLGRRAISPQRGFWSFPSGYVDRGEVVEEAAVREVQEETGLEIQLDGLVGLYSRGGNPVVLAVYTGHAVGGTLAPGAEMLELGVFPPDALPAMAFPHDREIIADWRKLRARLERCSRRASGATPSGEPDHLQGALDRLGGPAGREPCDPSS